MIDKDKVGNLYTTKGRDIWRLVSYCHEPTATMLNLETGEKVNGAVGCLNLEPFKELVIKENTAKKEQK